MQYCTKCKMLCDDTTTVCPNCKRATRLRKAKDNDLVYFIKVSEFESEEIDSIFSDNGIRFEIKPHKTSAVSSVYDCTYLPSDKVIYVFAQDVETAKTLLENMQNEQEIDEEDIPKPNKKTLLKQSLFTIVFLSAVMLLILLAVTIGGTFGK